ncbi:MAG: hypothetical protein ACXWF2_13165 [Usitatibacter sp.]
MDFDKPYVPSTSAPATQGEPAGDNPPRKRGTQAVVPALFRKKAA